MPDIFRHENKSLVRLEFSSSPNCKPVFKLPCGTLLPRIPSFKTMTDCYVGDAICTVYGFANFSGSNTLKVRLDELFIKTKVKLDILPLNFNINKATSSSVAMSPEASQLAHFLLDNDPILGNSKLKILLYTHVTYLSLYLSQKYLLTPELRKVIL